MAKTGAKSVNSSAPTARAPMTQAAASRIQGATARANGGQVQAGTFSSRATRAAAHNAQSGSGGKK